MSALLSFLGGSAFRMVWGEVADFFKRRQEHAQELELQRVQGELAAAAHARTMETLRTQAELGIKTIEAQSDADEALAAADAFKVAMGEANKPTGIKGIDAWNGAIRPAAASIAILLWVFALNEQGYKMTEWDRELVGVILGFFFAHRVFSSKK